MSKRTITQIAVVPEFNEGMRGPYIVALADDGTLWLGAVNAYAPEWQQIPALPEAK